MTASDHPEAGFPVDLRGNVTPLWLTTYPVSEHRNGWVVDWSVVYVTTIHFSVTPFGKRFPRPLRWTLHQVGSLGFADASDLAAYVQFLDDKPQVQVNWSSFQNNDFSHEGSVEMTVQWGDAPTELSTMSWGYEPLDDPDNAEPLPIPVDFRTEVVGALSPAQQEKFWSLVNEKLQPLQVIDAVLKRFGLTPTHHDEMDEVTLRNALALDWYRNFPSLEAGERVLNSQPDLTDIVLGQLTLMASRCSLEGKEYELFEVFVADIA